MAKGKSSGNLGSLFFGMTLDTKDFKKRLKEARKTVKSVGAEISGAFKAIAKSGLVIGAAGAAAGAGVLLFAKNSLEATNAQLLLADSIGATQKEIAGLELMTNAFGVETNMVIDKMREVGGLDEFKKLSEQVKGAGNEQDQLNESIKLFGNEGAKMLPLLQQGAAGFAAMETEAERLGLALDPEQVAASRVAWEQLEGTIFAVKGLGKQIGAAFLKPLGTIAAGVEAFITTFKTEIMGGVQLAAGLMQDFIMGAFDLFSRYGIPFINGFISFAGMIGEAFENLFAFLSPATDSALGGISEMFDTIIAFIATFKQSMIIGIAKPIEFVVRGAYAVMAKLTRVLQSTLSGMAFGLAELGVISDKTAENLTTSLGDLALEFTLAGRAAAKPFKEAQEDAAKEMEKILTEKALKNQKDQQKFKGIIGNFNIKFGDAIKGAGKVAEKVTDAITGKGSSISDQFAGLALSGSQEEQRLLNAGKAERTQQDILKANEMTNKILKNITVW